MSYSSTLFPHRLTSHWQKHRNFAKAAGGATANVAVGLAKLGVDSGFIGKIGDEPFGDFLRQTLKQSGVDTTHLLAEADRRTTLAFVATRSDGAKDILFYRNPGGRYTTQT